MECGPLQRLKRWNSPKRKSLTLSDTLNLVHYGREVMSLPAPRAFILLPAFCLPLSLSARARLLSGARRSITICGVGDQSGAGVSRAACQSWVTPDHDGPITGSSTPDAYYAPYYLTLSENVAIHLWSIHDNKEAGTLIKVEALVDGSWRNMSVFIFRR